MTRIRYLILFAFLIVLTCAVLDENRNHSPYYSNGRFQNLADDSKLVSKSLWTVLRWKLFGPEDSHFPGTRPDQLAKVKFLDTNDFYPKTPDKYRLTWLGHATVLISLQIKDRNVVLITDPVFDDIPLKSRLTKLPIPKNKLPKIDYVLISHNHFDHCDVASLSFLQSRNPKTVFIFPEGMMNWAKNEKLIHVKSMRWWEIFKQDGLMIQHLPAQHWSRRTLTDRMQHHWGSYAIVSRYVSIYFAGDTAYSTHFNKIHERYPQGFDYAILPIGSYSPRWFMKTSHINPAEAVQAGKVLAVKTILPIHWGTFALGDDYPLEPVLEFEKNSIQENVKGLLWRPGFHEKDQSIISKE